MKSLIFGLISIAVKILKKATVHSWRHGFATHLLGSSVDLRYIEEIL